MMDIGIFSNLLPARKARQTAIKFRKEQKAIRRKETIAKYKPLISEIDDARNSGLTKHDTVIPNSDWKIVASCLKARGYKISETPFYLKHLKDKKNFLEKQDKNGSLEKAMFIKW